MIQKHTTSFPVDLMCRLLSVSTSAYYAWAQGSQTQNQQQNTAVVDAVKRIFEEEKHRSGAPRITRRLHRAGIQVGHNRVAKIMRLNGWRAKAARKFKATTNSNHSRPVSPNLLGQVFTAVAPNQKWVSDITCIWTDEGWLYLAVVMDLYSRRVLGWSMSERMSTVLVSDALEMALWRRRHPRGVLLHSDRGGQYCSHAYQKQLKENGLICSMSKKGDCYDNAAMESWNHSLKVEAIHGERFSTRAHAKQAVFEYIEIYYNRTRLHSKLGFISPESFEAQQVA